MDIDEIMALAGAFADAEDADFALHTLDELRAAVAALVAERDLAVHEQDMAQESLRQHQVWLQEAQAERDALRQDAEAFRMAVECGEPFVVRGACVTTMSGKHEDFNPHIPGDDLRATREIIHRAYAQFKGQR